MALKGPGNPPPAHKASKTPPPEDTRQEAAYLKSLGENQTRVNIKLMDGEFVSGWVEYYDRRMVRLTREGAPNLFIFKHDIAYIAEQPAVKLRTEKIAATSASPRRAK